jgi:ribonuclease HII
MAKTSPDYMFEQLALTQGARVIAGVDEAGRGPLAGPVVAAAVILDPMAFPKGINDSKKLSKTRLADLFQQIIISARVGVGMASVAEIDKINILRASHLAMVRAIDGLGRTPDLCLIDGNLIPRDLILPAQAIVKGDGKSLSIAAASIIAKVTRDRIMVDLAQQHPGYGWENNAGYPTTVHIKALQQLGVTPHHRRSFRPVHNILYQAISVSD